VADRGPGFIRSPADYVEGAERGMCGVRILGIRISAPYGVTGFSPGGGRSEIPIHSIIRIGLIQAGRLNSVWYRPELAPFWALSCRAPFSDTPSSSGPPGGMAAI